MFRMFILEMVDSKTSDLNFWMARMLRSEVQIALKKTLQPTARAPTIPVHYVHFDYHLLKTKLWNVPGATDLFGPSKSPPNIDHSETVLGDHRSNSSEKVTGSPGVPFAPARCSWAETPKDHAAEAGRNLGG